MVMSVHIAQIVLAGAAEEWPRTSAYGLIVPPLRLKETAPGQFIFQTRTTSRPLTEPEAAQLQSLLDQLPPTPPPAPGLASLDGINYELVVARPAGVTVYNWHNVDWQYHPEGAGWRPVAALMDWVQALK